MNKTITCGHVGSIKPLHKFQNGNCVLRFSLATNDYWRNQQGEQQTKVQWHRIVAYDAYALSLVNKLKVGDKLYIEGSLDYNTYVNRDNISVPTTEIKVTNFNILTTKETAYV